MKILYTGPFRIGSLTESRRQALKALGHEVIGLNQALYIDRWPFFFRKAQLHLLIGPGIWEYNRDIVNLVNEVKPDLIYVDQGAYLWPRTVARIKIKTPRVIHYTSEFLGFQRYWYRHFSRAIGLYDVHVITNLLNRPLLEKRGAKKVFVTNFGYDPLLHKVPILTSVEKEKYKSDVVFIGHWEPTTERMIVQLRMKGVSVRVWGQGWWRARSMEDRRNIQPIVGKNYVKALGSSKICLCFLSKWNRNQTAGRTFEIPAVGNFLLAERTPEHLSFFREGKEAEFFSSGAELVRKARYYLENDGKRLEIAQAGHQRCIKSGYTHSDRMREILKDIF